MTPRECDLLNAIIELTENDVPPTYQNLADRIGLKSKCGIHRMVLSLEAQGRITRDPYRYRTLKAVSPLNIEISRLISLYGRDAVRAEVMR